MGNLHVFEDFLAWFPNGVQYCRVFSVMGVGIREWLFYEKVRFIFVRRRLCPRKGLCASPLLFLLHHKISPLADKSFR